jgi:hypothetical protein
LGELQEYVCECKCTMSNVDTDLKMAAECICRSLGLERRGEDKWTMTSAKIIWAAASWGLLGMGDPRQLKCGDTVCYNNLQVLDGMIMLVSHRGRAVKSEINKKAYYLYNSTIVESGSEIQKNLMPLLVR